MGQDLLDCSWPLSDSDGLSRLLSEVMDDDNCSSDQLTDMLSELMEDSSGLDSESDDLAFQLGKVMTEDIRPYMRRVYQIPARWKQWNLAEDAAQLSVWRFDHTRKHQSSARGGSGVGSSTATT